MCSKHIILIVIIMIIIMIIVITTIIVIIVIRIHVEYMSPSSLNKRYYNSINTIIS